MSTFDPDTFLDATFTEASVTQAPPPPEGEAVATVRSVKAKVVGQDNKPILEVMWGVDGHTGSGARQTIWLEEGPSGAPDLASTPAVGKLRTATGLNKVGEVFSLRMLEGRSAKVLIKNELGRDGNVYARVVNTSPV